MLLIFLPMKTSVATRRSFLKSSLAGVFAAGVAPQFIPARLLGANAPSNKITLGCIGLGAHGIGVNLKSFLQQDDCRIVAVCDVWGRRREEARKLVDEKHGGPGCAMIALRRMFCTCSAYRCSSKMATRPASQASPIQ